MKTSITKVQIVWRKARAGRLAAIVMAMVLCPFFALAQVDSIDSDILSLDSLLNLRISSVSKYEQTTAEAPASVTIIAREDILSFGYNDLAELLTGVRDLYLSNDRNYGYLGVRGFSRPTDFNNRMAIMVNGVLMNENVWGQGAIGSEIDGLNLDDVERVEIIRGPASALHGNYPMQGLINIITHTGKTQDGLRLSAEHGSYGKWQSSLAAGKLWGNGLDVHVGARVGTIAGQNLYYREYDDSLHNFGIADHRDGSKYVGVNGRMAYKFLTLKWLYTWRDVGVPTGSYGSLFNDPDNHTVDSYGNVELGAQHEASDKLAFQGRTWLSHYHYNGYFDYDTADGGMQRELSQSYWAGIEGRLRWDIAANDRLMVGVEAQHHFLARYYLDYPTRVVFDQNFPFQTFSFYVQNEYQPIKQLMITAGGRYDRLYLGRNAVTPRLAVNFFAGKSTTFKLLFGQAFRAPTIYEVNVGFDGYILPNLNLRPERVNSLELVYEQRLADHFFAVGSLYTNHMLHLIEQTVVMDSLLQFQNVQQAGGYGGSAEFNGRLDGGTNFYVNYSFAQMRNLDSEAWLTNSPHHLFKAGISIPIFHHFRLSPEMWGQTARLTVYGSETKPCVVGNVNLMFAPRFKGRAQALNRFQLSFKVRNVLNTDYRYPGGFEHLQHAIQQNGRNYNLKLQVSLF